MPIRSVTYEQILRILPQLVKHDREEVASHAYRIFFDLVTPAIDALTENVWKRIRTEYLHDEDAWKNPPWGQVSKHERQKAVQTLIDHGKWDGLELGRTRWACEQALYIRWRSRYDKQQEKKKDTDP